MPIHVRTHIDSTNYFKLRKLNNHELTEHDKSMIRARTQRTLSTSIRDGSVVSKKSRSIIPSPLMADVGTMLMNVRTSCGNSYQSH